MYLALKFILTILVCRDKLNSTKLKFLEKGMPVCFCREALKIWQITLIYGLPVLLMYALLFALNIWVLGEPTFMLLFVFMSFFLSFDLTLIIYVLAVSRKEKIDYVSIDHHVYSLTIFKQTYVRFSDKVIKRNAETEKPESKIKPKAFKKMIICLNPKCESYGQDADKNVKICPSCGNRKYKAEVLTNVVTCLNEDCENYGQELKQEIETCSICGEKTGKMAFKFNPALAIPAIVISIISSVVFGYLYFRSAGRSLGPMDFVRNIVFAINIVMGYISKSKAALIVSIMSVVFIIVFTLALQ